VKKSVRFYLISIGCTVGSIAFAIIGDREAFRERNAETWSDALADNAKKVADGASAVSD
jgi:hypothetical protein